MGHFLWASVIHFDKTLSSLLIGGYNCKGEGSLFPKQAAELSTSPILQESNGISF